MTTCPICQKQLAPLAGQAGLRNHLRSSHGFDYEDALLEAARCSPPSRPDPVDPHAAVKARMSPEQQAYLRFPCPVCSAGEGVPCSYEGHPRQAEKEKRGTSHFERQQVAHDALGRWRRKDAEERV